MLHLEGLTRWIRAATNLGCGAAPASQLLAKYPSCVPILSRPVVIRRGNPCDSYRRAFLGQVSRALVVQDDARLSPVERALPVVAIAAGGVARRRSSASRAPGDQNQWRSRASSSAAAILSLASSGASWSQAMAADPSSDSSSPGSRSWEDSSI